MHRFSVARSTCSARAFEGAVTKPLQRPQVEPRRTLFILRPLRSILGRQQGGHSLVAYVLSDAFNRQM